MKVVKIQGMRFMCGDTTELWRANTIFTKEPGTISWLKRELRESDIFFDIGANIGLYSVFAAQIIRVPGMVFAFEPHVGNAHSLLRNIRENNVGDRVKMITTPLHNAVGMFAFNYMDSSAGSSGSQLGHTISESGSEFAPIGVELKYAVTMDYLMLKSGLIPTILKMDVDGNELRILQGASKTFTGKKRPRTVQIEMHPKDDIAIMEYMTQHGYALAERHYTASGNQKIAKGADPSTIPHNAIFNRT